MRHAPLAPIARAATVKAFPSRGFAVLHLALALLSLLLLAGVFGRAPDDP